MQYLTNKWNFKFTTNAGRSDAYSPFAQVPLELYDSTSTISRIRGVDFSQIAAISQVVKLSLFWLLLLLCISILL